MSSVSKFEDIIFADIESIYREVGGQQGIYDEGIIERVFRDQHSIRVYALDVGCGGFAFIGQKSLYGQGKWEYSIIPLGEDDGSFFPDIDVRFDKSSLMDILGRVMSLFNNNI